jgi:hypothetical protein
MKIWLYKNKTVKVKGKVVPVFNLAPRREDVWGSGDIAPPQS